MGGKAWAGVDESDWNAEEYSGTPGPGVISFRRCCRQTNLSIRSCFIRRFDRKVILNLDEAAEYRRKREKRKSMAMDTNPQIGRFSDVDATNEAE